MDSNTYCSPFDAALAAAKVPAVFLSDSDGNWRLHPSWSRDCWGRNAEQADPDPGYCLARDRATGLVQMVFTTSRGLLEGHPRLDVRVFNDFDAAAAAFEGFGTPPLAKDPW